MYRFKFKYEMFDTNTPKAIIKQGRLMQRKTDPPLRRRTSVEIYFKDYDPAGGEARNTLIASSDTITQHPIDPDLKPLARRLAVTQALDKNHSELSKEERSMIWKAYFEQHSSDKIKRAEDA